MYFGSVLCPGTEPSTASNGTPANRHKCAPKFHTSVSAPWLGTKLTSA